jgi:hypothetical protein
VAAKKLILVIHAVEESRNLLSSRLAGAGYDVLGAGSLAEGLLMMGETLGVALAVVDGFPGSGNEPEEPLASLKILNLMGVPGEFGFDATAIPQQQWVEMIESSLEGPEN